MKYLSLILAIGCLFSFNANADPIPGKQLYQAYCAQCHGMESDGYGINIEYMEVQPRDHTDTKDMMSRTDDDLFKVIKYGGKSIDKSVLMPNWEGTLSDDDIDLLVGYLRVLCCQDEEN